MSQLLYQHQWMDLYANDHDEAFIKMQDMVMMIPIMGDKIILIEEQSIAYAEPMLVFPMGGIEADETPLDAANRELEEEIGYKAGKLALIGLLHPSLKYAQWRCWVCLAQELEPQQRAGDERTPVIRKLVTTEAINGLIASGDIQDSTVIAAFYLANKHMKTAV